MTLATELAAYIETLTISQGRHAGQPFKLLPWEKRFISGSFKDGVMDAALSLGRGNGKSTLVSAIAAATVDVDGPLQSPRAESVIVASSFEQGMICFRHVLSFLQPTLQRHGIGPKGRYRLQDSANRAQIVDQETGSMLRCVGSDPARSHGIAPRLILLDEAAQFPQGNIDRMVASLETSRGKSRAAVCSGWVPAPRAAVTHSRRRFSLEARTIARSTRRTRRTTHSASGHGARLTLALTICPTYWRPSAKRLGGRRRIARSSPTSGPCA